MPDKDLLRTAAERAKRYLQSLDARAVQPPPAAIFRVAEQI